MSVDIKTLKILSEENLRKLIALIISLASSIDSLKQKCIEDYNSTKTYLKDSFVIYDGYLYKINTVMTGDFDENKATKIGDDLKLVDLQLLKSLLGLTTDEIEALNKILDDYSISTIYGWSSSKIYAELENVLRKSRQYTVEQFSKVYKPGFEIVTSESDMTDPHTIYLMLSPDGSVWKYF